MAGITVKALNNQYSVIGEVDVFSEFISECEKKLYQIASKSEHFFRAFFVFNRPLQTEELIALFECSKAANTIILGIGTHEKTNPIKIFAQAIHAGQSYVFYEDTLILNDVIKDSYISAHGNLYVVGEVSGCIDLMHQECICTCASMNDAKIRIYDTPFQNYTSFTSNRLYYEQGEIKTLKLKEAFYGM